jgi:hypothetical protein
MMARDAKREVSSMYTEEEDRKILAIGLADLCRQLWRQVRYELLSRPGTSYMVGAAVRLGGHDVAAQLAPVAQRWLRSCEIYDSIEVIPAAVRERWEEISSALDQRDDYRAITRAIDQLLELVDQLGQVVELGEFATELSGAIFKARQLLP